MEGKEGGPARNTRKAVKKQVPNKGEQELDLDPQSTSTPKKANKAIKGSTTPRTPRTPRTPGTPKKQKSGRTERQPPINLFLNRSNSASASSVERSTGCEQAANHKHDEDEQVINQCLVSPSTLSASYHSTCSIPAGINNSELHSTNNTLEFESTINWLEDKNKSNMNGEKINPKDKSTKEIDVRNGTNVGAKTNIDATSRDQSKETGVTQTEAAEQAKQTMGDETNANSKKKEDISRDGESKEESNDKSEATEKLKTNEIEMNKEISNAEIRQMFLSLTGQVADLRTDLTSRIDGLKEEKEQDQQKIKQVEDKIQNCENKIQKVCDEVQIRDDKIDRLLDVIQHNSLLIRELNNKVEGLEKGSMQDNLVIKGLIRKGKNTEKEDCVATVKSFFKEQLEIKEEITIRRAFRIGKSKVRTMMVILKNGRDKAKIFANVSNLQEKKNANDKPYKIENQLPARMAEERKKHRTIKYRNKKQSVAEQLQIQLQKGKLMVEGKPYESQIVVPDGEKLARLKADEIQVLLDQEIRQGITIEYGTSSFTGYVCDVQSYFEVNKAYEYVKFLNLGARHIVCACILPSVDNPICCDFEDMNEHGAGDTLLSYMLEAELENRAIFIVREYDGTHIGPKRFECIVNAAKSATNHKPYNRYSEKYQFSWGKGRGGMAGGRPLRHMRDMDQDSVGSFEENTDSEVEFKRDQNSENSKQKEVIDTGTYHRAWGDITSQPAKDYPNGENNKAIS